MPFDPDTTDIDELALNLAWLKLLNGGGFQLGPQPEPANVQESSPLMEAVEHAPAGGATIAGKQFRGGQFIPSQDMAKATPAEKAALKQKQQQGKTAPAGGANPEQSQAKAAADSNEPKHQLTFKDQLDLNRNFSQRELDLPAWKPQRAKSEEMVYHFAEKHKPSFDSGLDTGQGVDRALGGRAVRPQNESEFIDALKQPGAVVIIPDLKGKARAAEKVNNKYGGDWSQLTDVVRGTVGVDHTADVPTAIEAVRNEMAKHGWKIASKPQDRMTQPMPGGYRDLLMLFEKQGQIAELQINVKPMLLAKAKAHAIYEDRRSLAEGIKKQQREPTPEEAAKLKSMDDQMEQVYNAAWKEAS